MTTIWEIERELPNGFHDAFISRYGVDFVRRAATFHMDLWVGDLSNDTSVRERRRPVILAVEGLAFLQADAPQELQRSKESRLWVDLSELEPEHPLSARLCAPEPAPTGD